MTYIVERYHNDTVYVCSCCCRNHLNDLENIPPFLFLGLLYVLIKPTPFAAIWHFRAFAISRILHTICYQWAVPQPSRALCFAAGLGVCVSMAVHVIAKATWQ